MAKEVSVDVGRIAALLPTMPLSRTVNQWRNALRALADPKRQPIHAAARITLDLIRQEWTRRRGRPPAPGDSFAWPTTAAAPGRGEIGTEDWLEHGVLKFMGYKVGNTDGETLAVRQRILAEIFSGPIPPAFPDYYIKEWGLPGSAVRLRKLADTVAALARNARRRRGASMDIAIRDWSADLEALYWDYYVGHFQFDWPKASL